MLFFYPLELLLVRATMNRVELVYTHVDYRKLTNSILGLLYFLKSLLQIFLFWDGGWYIYDMLNQLRVLFIDIDRV